MGIYVAFDEIDCSHRVATHRIPNATYFNISPGRWRKLLEEIKNSTVTKVPVEKDRKWNTDLCDLVDDINERLGLKEVGPLDDVIMD